jgi:hypothetical protein
MTTQQWPDRPATASRSLYSAPEAVAGSPAKRFLRGIRADRNTDRAARPIPQFDRHHPSVPTCTPPVPARAAAVKDGPSSGHRVSGA